MKTALIFDVKEFAIHDGPGVRLTFFLKGCPLRCKWCHNPEGQSFKNEYNLVTKKYVAEPWTSFEVAEYAKKFSDLFLLSKGGITFSGGEALYFYEFIKEVKYFLKNENITIAIETSGYAKEEIFLKVLHVVDIMLFDIKLYDGGQSEYWIGKDNTLILKNLEKLSLSGMNFIVRIPLIPGVTTRESNLIAIFNHIARLKNKPEKVELLNYNHLAGAKYSNINRKFTFKPLGSINFKEVNEIVLKYATGLNVIIKE